jgi:hypothetical protein
MLYSEIIAVCSQIHINTLCGQNVELLVSNLVVHKVTTGHESVNKNVITWLMFYDISSNILLELRGSRFILHLH